VGVKQMARSRTRRPRGSQALPRAARHTACARTASAAGRVGRPATALRCLNAPHPRPAPGLFSGEPSMAQPTEPVGLAETLIGKYALEAEMYQALLFLAREQGSLLKYDKDIGSYAALLPRKDELLRSIGLIERDLEPLKRRWWTVDVGAESRAPRPTPRWHPGHDRGAPRAGGAQRAPPGQPGRGRRAEHAPAPARRAARRRARPHTCPLRSVSETAWRWPAC